jgi:hypothetical protein
MRLSLKFLGGTGFSTFAVTERRNVISIPVLNGAMPFGMNMRLFAN